MRLVLSNPHIHYYGKIIWKVLFRLKDAVKYSFIIEEFVKNPHRDTAFLIDGTRSSFNEIGIRFFLFPKLFATLELFIWMALNRINPFRHKVYFDVKQLNPRNDVLFNFALSTLDSFPRNSNRIQFDRYRGPVVTHLTHYMNEPAKLNEEFKKIEHSFLVAENDLTNNDFFHHYLPDVKEVYYLPFSYRSRFKPLVPFAKRKRKCFAVGTFSTGRPKSFIEFFGKGTNLQPMRKIIHERRKELAPYIDSYMYDFDDDRSVKEIAPGDSWKVQLLKKTLHPYILYNLLPSRQTKYLAFDIVQKHNEYQMFTSPEEIIGLPSNNMVEGMACGTAYVGAIDPMYSLLGMVPGVHYIGYKKDSLKDLVEKITYWQKHPRELARIAEQGRKFVSRFTPHAMGDTFWHDLEQLMESFKTGKPQFACSFRDRKV